jgi:beta-glucosidase
VLSPPGNAVPDPSREFPRPVVYHPSSPLRAIQAAAPQAQVRFADGRDPAAAARLAADSDVAVVFATQWTAEAFDVASLSLPDGQDGLIAAVAAANPKTVVLLETGGPVLMPWLERVGAVLEAWYPGSRGGEAIARLLFGEISPTGRLPITFPRSEAQLPRPKLDGLDLPKDAPFRVRYGEGAAVGYKWFDQQRLAPLFPFGHGLTYSRFTYGRLSAQPAPDGAVVSFDVTNTGARAAMDVPQVYLGLPPEAGRPPRRLIGWNKLLLRPGETRRVTVRVHPRLLALYEGQGWRVRAGSYPVYLGASSRDLPLQTTLQLTERRLEP